MTHMIYNTRCFFSGHLVRGIIYRDIFAEREGRNIKRQ